MAPSALDDLRILDLSGSGVFYATKPNVARAGFVTGGLMQEYVLIIHPAEEGGYWAEIPALPGCFVQGESVEELLSEAPEIMEAYLAVIQEDGDHR